ncbi:CHRD domain-containing protein [Sandarakinorhabdus rubra]|uniref:CHRD domain-containing protein n=1 Tax=Sandarakinorhabdus rubra TaxID=2672568 RepID=UPI0013DB4E27|nr:CHRD domain-containing protein [Sandarakinorhabdus rubra]
MIRTLLAVALLAASSAANAVSYTATFSGAAENPPNASLATGTGLLRVVGTSIIVDIEFANLGSGLRDAHIHCCSAPTGNGPVAIGFTNLPLDQTSGSIERVLDLTLASTFRSAFITASGGTVDLARARLLDQLAAGNVYYNLHTVNFPGGEIRGNLAAVPEPASWAMLLSGFGLVGATMRRRKAALA